jgi:hypothetical protein
VRARRFVVVDDRGVERAKLIGLSDGDALLLLGNVNGNHVRLSVLHGTPTLSLSDGQDRVNVGVTPDGIAGLYLSNTEGRPVS